MLSTIKKEHKFVSLNNKTKKNSAGSGGGTNANQPKQIKKKQRGQKKKQWVVEVVTPTNPYIKSAQAVEGRSAADYCK